MSGAGRWPTRRPNPRSTCLSAPAGPEIFGGGPAAIETAYGTGKARCQLRDIGTTTPVKLTVRCFKPAGAPVDSDFTLAWTK